MHKCHRCKLAVDGCRVLYIYPATGQAFAPVCESCYAKEVAERRAEGKRLGYRPRIASWDKLEPASVYFKGVSNE